MCGRPIVVQPLASDAEARACAEIMCTSEPWITLRRTRERAFALVRDPTRETYVALETGEVVGFLVLCMQGAFVGYVQSVAVRADRRSLGLGRALLAFAEERIFRDAPNVFLCVASFNPRARALYERLGDRLVGALADFVVPGHAELLLRKTIAPLEEFRRGRSGA